MSVRPVGRRFPDPKFPAAKKGPASNDAFGRLGGPAFAAYGSGTVLHSDPELSGTDIAVTIDMAMADAVYSDKDLSGFADELGRPIVERLPASSGQAHGHAITVDPPEALGEDVDLGEPADSKAPPIARPVTRETKADLTVVKADLFRAEAAARAVSTGCVIGNDLSRAAASADDTDVGGSGSTKPLLSLGAEGPERAVSESKSRTYLVPITGAPGRFRAVSEVRQTIAPVTFGLPGSDEQFTIEVAGEWVMRASSDGSKGTVWFGGENTSDGDRPALRLIRGGKAIDEVGLRELGDRAGIFIDGDPVGDIRIGGEPRAILGRPDSRPTQTPTLVSAAADVVVVRLFESQAELRVGHMEVGLAVPPGGVPCPGISVTKTSDPETVRPGDAFSWNLEVSNLNDCVLDKVKVIDSPSASRDVDWKALTSVPRATQSPNGDLVFENIGPIATGETRVLKINAQVEPGSSLGTITNRAAAAGVCGDANLGGGAETVTKVGMITVPGVPRPSAGVAASDRPRRDDAAQSPEEPKPSSGPAIASTSARRDAAELRSASAARSASSTRSATAATGAQTAAGTAARGTSVAAPLARSGAEAGPSVLLALGLLAVGRLFRMGRVRRRR